MIRRKRIIASLRTARTSRPQRRSRHMLAVALLAVASTFAATATAFEDYTDVSSPPLPTSSIYTAGPPSFFFFSSMYVCVCVRAYAHHSSIQRTVALLVASVGHVCISWPQPCSVEVSALPRSLRPLIFPLPLRTLVHRPAQPPSLLAAIVQCRWFRTSSPPTPLLTAFLICLLCFHGGFRTLALAAAVLREKLAMALLVTKTMLQTVRGVHIVGPFPQQLRQKP